jgi:hypothetical protein
MLLTLAIVFLIVPASTHAVQAQDGTAALTTASTLNMRSGPGEDYAVITQLSYGTRLILEGRTADGYWIYAHASEQDARGWVTVFFLATETDTNTLALPIIEDARTQAPAASEAESEDAALPAEDSQNSAIIELLLGRLNAVPVVPETISERTREIFLRGQAMGRRPDVVTLVGDCHSFRAHFMYPFHTGDYTLGAYGYLAETAQYFGANSFVERSITANDGMHSAALVDPTWANPAYCDEWESPLQCEFRLRQPSIAIFLMGIVDLSGYSVEQFDLYMRRAVRETIEAGVVPVLNTFPSVTEELELRFNNVILDIAEDEQIPVINFWLAARALPNNGLDDDNVHLSGYRSWATRVDFDGVNEWREAIVLRNLITLQTLDVIRLNR